MEIERFKNSFGKNTFKNKYAQGPGDTWDALAERLVEDVCGSRNGSLPVLMNRTDREYLTQVIKEMKFIPGGRYLYYAGREYKAYNNCLGADTRVITDKGYRKVSELGTANVLSPVDGKFYTAEFKSHGKQPVYELLFSGKRGHQVHTWRVKATRTHHWPLLNGGDTYDIRVGDVVPANAYSVGTDDLGFIHGFIFGDGNSNGQLRLCANKDKKHLEYLSKFGTVTYPKSANGDPVLYFNHNIDWKKLPDSNTSPAYKASFISGWIQADGGETHSNKLCSVNKEALEWFREYAAFAGIVITGKLRSQIRDVQLGNYSYSGHEIWIQSYAYGEEFSGFKLTSKLYVGEEEVFCPYEPVHNRIVLEGNIDSFNCYLLRAETDTREEWSAVTWRAMSCLMTGGGIGIDYSRLRPSGKALRRTGGKASGPLPLMFTINEVGRNVMQGGSRRSAIYGSLHWQHEDIPLFLDAKNWGKQPVGTTGLSLSKLKEQDFNFPAPLDMTNISVNYDDTVASLPGAYGNITLGLKHNNIFKENVKQALMTGEPGFSFNFGDKQNETLRNAPLGGDTHVLLKNGSFPIRDIVNQEVEVWTGRQWATTTFKLTKEYADTVNVYISGQRMIVAEPSHEFFLADGSKKPAGELQVGDALMVSLPNPKPFAQNAKGYTLGYIYGDGSFHKKYPRAEITFCTNESKQCVDALDQSILTSVTWNDSRGYTRVYTKNDPIFSKRSKEVFPYDILDAGTDFLCSFMAGLFDSDGNYFEKQNRVRLASKHVGFLHGVRHCLEQLGILSGISTAGTSTFGNNLGYLLTVYGTYVDRFAEIIPTKRLQVKGFEPYRISKLKVIGTEKGKQQDVYCCDVKVNEHSFMAEGVIVSNCTEVTSEDDSDVCNLGSINLGNIKSIEEFKDVVTIASKFLVCGTLRADLPYEKVYKVREKNRRLGLGLMGIHEWLLQRNQKYEVTPELHEWLRVYKDESKRAADEHCDRFFLSRPVAYRAIAPTGTIGILAGTTTGIEPLYAVAYKRRFLTEGTKWKYQFVIDSTAEQLINDYGLKPEAIDTAAELALDPERRIKFQADIQDYVDMSISSTINLPPYGTEFNNDDKVESFTNILATYAPRLRGFTCYPDGSRGGQPITVIDYNEALRHKDVIFEESDICDITGKGGSCGV